VSPCLTQESKFLVLNERSAWERGLSVNLEVSDNGLKIRDVVKYVFEREDEIEVLSDTFDVKGFAVGPCSQLYILDAASSAIWIYDSNQKQIERIECVGKQFKKPGSIAYAAGSLYVADAEAEERVYALADLNLQIKFAIGTRPRSDSFSLPLPFAPIDLAVDDEGNLFALDQQNLAILRFDEAAQLVDVFGQAELEGKQPVSIALSRAGGLYVLDLADQKVLKFPTWRNGATVDPQFIDFQILINRGILPRAFKPSGFAIDEGGVIYVGDSGENGPGRVDQEDDRFIRKFDSEGKYLGVVEGFRGAVDQLVVDPNNSIFVFRAGEKNRITALRPERRFAQFQGASLVKGRYISRAFDSADAGTIWHKLSSVTRAPPNTQVQISFLSAEDKRMKIGKAEGDLDVFLDETARLDPAIDSQRDEGQVRLADLDKLGWCKPVVNSDDALIAAEGRYLWARIDLIGSEQQSPSVQSLRVDYPRISYLRYLPAVYQDDERSRDFLERFLSLFETFFAGIEAQVDHIARYFDPDSRVAHSEFLRWLSTWLSISVDNNWDDAKLTTLIRRASGIYHKRGTRAAIEEMIEIFTGDRPLVIEHHQGSGAAWLNQTRDSDLKTLRDLYEGLYGKDPFCFCVLLKPFPVKTEEHRNAVRRILDAEKPAHTCAGLLALQPWVQLDTHTYLEVNTYLSEPSARLDFGSSMPRDTVLNDLEQTGQLERRSRINQDTTLI